MSKIESKIEELQIEVHNTKVVTYINFAILLVLLAFILGAVAKQLGF